MRRSALSIDRTELLGFALALTVTVVVTVTAYVYADPRELGYLVFTPLGLSAVAVRRARWLVVTGAICIDAFVAAWQLADGSSVMTPILSMTASVIISIAIHSGRRRSFASILAARQAERDRHGELIAAATRERELAEQLRHVQKLDAIGTLAGGIAHDINNVLAAILGVAELGMEDHPPTTDVHHEFQHIVTAAERGAALTRNLLGFARRGKVRHEPVVITRIIDEVLALLGRTAPRRIKLERTGGAELENAAVMGDPSQLGQVVMNLCLNAIDAIAGAGVITIGVSLHELASGERATLAAGRYLCVEVGDTGAGMTAETLEHAFEPFYSTKSSTSQRGGSGLGLAMVYGTVRDHLGEVSLRSAPGTGTTATIYLPAVGEGAAAAAAPREPRAATARVPDLITSRPVLVIDDEEIVRAVCTRMLGAHDVGTRDAAGGRAGLELFRADPGSFSLVLLDLAMPEMTGAECFRALRAVDPDIPIVIMSGFPKDQSVEDLLALGRATFLPKPFQRSALVDALVRCRP